jgi:hypothetical protein
LLVEAIKCDWRALRTWLDEHRYDWIAAGINVVASRNPEAIRFIRTALHEFERAQVIAREEELKRHREAVAHLPSVFADSAGKRVPLLFGAGDAGVACLGNGWTPPAPIYGPWSIEAGASLTLSAGSVPANVRELRASALVFAPGIPPFEGQRRVVVRIAGEVACDEVVRNLTADTVAAHTFSCSIPLNRSLDAPLRIEFDCEHQVSPAEIGLAFDTRPLGLALMRIEVA